jgi:phage regulator Rha-like protein
MNNTLEPEKIINKIHVIRGKKIILDRDIAHLYKVETKVLNQATRRNINRFPEDFMFQLTQDEFESLRSQFVTLKTTRGQHSKYLPFAFTEQGIAMLSSVLHSDHAIQINIQIMRAFVELRKAILANEKVLHEIEKLKSKVERHDQEIETIILTIEKMLSPDEKTSKKIGFKLHDDGVSTKTKKVIVKKTEKI